jgi:hypothetical protein
LELVLMSKRELQRVEVLSKVVERRMTSTAAASLLGVTARQVQRLLKTSASRFMLQSSGVIFLKRTSLRTPSWFL